MRILIIHNDNLPKGIIDLSNENGWEFISYKVAQASVSEEDYDTFLSRQVKELTSPSSGEVPFEPDLIVLPYSLSETNPAELTGIRLAAHIRLDEQGGKNKYKPILFIGPNTIEECLRLDTDSIAGLLLTRAIYTSNVNSMSSLIEWIKQRELVLQPLTKDDYSSFLKAFTVKAPSNFNDSHHSIANVWGAAVLSHRVTTEPMPENAISRDFLNSLYFKHIRARYSITDSEERTVVEMGASGKKFLLIDDEAEKGWSFALSKYLRLSSRFDIISEKVGSYDGYSEQAKRLIEEGDYDIIFLDLRLNGSDEEKDIKPSEFSGMSVLKKIKSINQGTQVIMFTASNKSWNLKALLDAGADGYYVKPSPEFYTDGYIDANFQSLSEAIKHCLGRLYLRPLYQRIRRLMKVCDDSVISEDISSAIKSHLEISFSLLSTAGNEAQYSYAFLALFSVVEEFVQFFINGDLIYYDDIGLGNDVAVGNWFINHDRFERDGDAIPGSFSIAHKVIAIYKEVFKKNMPIVKAKQLVNYKDRRNSFIHPTERSIAYPSLNTPRIGDKKAFEQLFEIVETMLSDCGKLVISTQ